MACRAGRMNAQAYEVIVVDDGSRDATNAVATRLAAGDPHVRVVTHPRNRGYGAALRTGIAAAHAAVGAADRRRPAVRPRRPRRVRPARRRPRRHRRVPPAAQRPAPPAAGGGGVEPARRAPARPSRPRRRLRLQAGPPRAARGVRADQLRRRDLSRAAGPLARPRRPDLRARRAPPARATPAARAACGRASWSGRPRSCCACGAHSREGSASVPRPPRRRPALSAGGGDGRRGAGRRRGAGAAAERPRRRRAGPVLRRRRALDGHVVARLPVRRAGAGRERVDRQARGRPVAAGRDDAAASASRRSRWCCRRRWRGWRRRAAAAAGGDAVGRLRRAGRRRPRWPSRRSRS